MICHSLKNTVNGNKNVGDMGYLYKKDSIQTTKTHKHI